LIKNAHISLKVLCAIFVLVTPVPSDTNDGNVAENVSEYIILTEITQAERNNGETNGNLLVCEKANEDINLELDSKEAAVNPTDFAVNSNLRANRIPVPRTCYRCYLVTTCRRPKIV
jgi:hypothetical protein